MQTIHPIPTASAPSAAGGHVAETYKLCTCSCRKYYIYNQDTTKRLCCEQKIIRTMCDPYHGSCDPANPHGRGSTELGKVGLPSCWFLEAGGCRPPTVTTRDVHGGFSTLQTVMERARERVTYSLRFGLLGRDLGARADVLAAAWHPAEVTREQYVVT
jgi:hypothetical protein